MTDTLIKAEGISKKFCRSLKKSLWYGIQDLGNEMRGRRHGGNGELREDEFWAVRDTALEVKRGQCLALIGRNGAGKTTLLRMLNGLIKPDKGSIEIHGKVGALIALGAGFNPILTGRENIHVSAAVAGLSKTEIKHKLNGIIEFAELGNFIDSPVQNYSSGMKVRLGFAVASSLSPDIIILDEVLAVGDAAFRNKCYNRLGEIARDAAVILVSHNMHDLSRLATAGIVMSNGRSVNYSDARDAIRAYEAENNSETQGGFEKVDGTYIIAATTPKTLEIDFNHNLQLEIKLKCERLIEEALVRVVCYSRDESIFAEWNNAAHRITIPPGESKLLILASKINFVNGEYSLGININDKNGLTMLYWNYKQTKIVVRNGPVSGPPVFLDATAEIHIEK